MMRLPRWRRPADDLTKMECQEIQLVTAEKRASTLVEKADFLHTVVTRRDRENHWQASVNQLFLGGTQ